jgi:hypothetical protein
MTTSKCPRHRRGLHDLDVRLYNSGQAATLVNVQYK